MGRVRYVEPDRPDVVLVMRDKVNRELGMSQAILDMEDGVVRKEEPVAAPVAVSGRSMSQEQDYPSSGIEKKEILVVKKELPGRASVRERMQAARKKRLERQQKELEKN